MTSNPERMSAGDWYITDESVMDLQRERQTLMERYNASPVADPLTRRELLVELMGELVDHHVVAVVGHRGAFQHILPGQDHLGLGP